ncbi:MAG: glycosyltransferase [Planctomycetes bacterium]|nr:glycosyltransferase [Planctomycetota bacterium]
MLSRYTQNSFELIVVDNASSDGSADFFQSVGARVLRQGKNCNYSIAMNIGTGVAIGDFICQINNDVIVSPSWDKFLIDAMERYKLDFAWPSSIEFMPTYGESKNAIKKWRKIGKLPASATKEKILAVWERMYIPDWEGYCDSFHKRNKGLVDGINGHTLMMRRSAWQKIGAHDERMLATDWDLYLRAKKRELESRDLRAPKVVCDVYVHHFMQTTARVATKGYDSNDKNTIYDIRDKWPNEELKDLFPTPMLLEPAPTINARPFAYFKYAFKRYFNLYQWGDRW